MTRVAVVSGVGRYADPWHDFAATSSALADVIRELGWDVEIRPSEPAALLVLSGVDVCVINTGGGDPAAPPTKNEEWERAFQSLADFQASGGAILGVHTAANTFPDWPKWPTLLGGRWVRGVSSHPPLGEAVFEVLPSCQGSETLHHVDDLPWAAPSEHQGVSCYDERYCELEVFGGSIPLLGHEHAGRRHTVAWMKGQVAYSGLGHGRRSYESPSHRRFLADLLQQVATHSRP